VALGLANLSSVMPGLVPAIHALSSWAKQGVDGRDKPGHDKRKFLTSIKML